MNTKNGDCLRCESVGREPNKGIKTALGPNGIETLVCNKCWNEIEYFLYASPVFANENEED